MKRFCLSPLTGVIVALLLLLLPSAHAQERFNTVIPLHVEADQATVSLSARDVPLRHVLQEIARQSGIRLHLLGGLEETVSLELDHRPIREALHSLLRGHAFVLRCTKASPETATSARAGSVLWVYGEETADGSRGIAEREPGGYQALLPRVPTPDLDRKARLKVVHRLVDGGGDEASEQLAETALTDPDPAVREEAVYGLGVLAKAVSLPALREALSDPALRVREAAVEALIDLGGDPAAWTLAPALEQGGAAWRERIVFALAEIDSESVPVLLERALADPDAAVQDASLEALEELSWREVPENPD